MDEDGFLKTGDLGYVNEKGCVYIIDRKKDIFKSKGHKINPIDIENVIQQIKGVELVVVFEIHDVSLRFARRNVSKKKQSICITKAGKNNSICCRATTRV